MTRGRPKQFDNDRAIDQAMSVFWKMGYDGTTLDNLTDAMGISRPSLYSAFGNKELLFRRVLDRYRETSASYFHEALKKPTARLVFEALLEGAIKLQTDPANPGGCLLVQGALAAGEPSEHMRRELAQRRASAENLVGERFQTAIAEGDLPADIDAADLARFTTTILHGLAVQAAGGDTREQLMRVARFVLAVFPDSPR